MVWSCPAYERWQTCTVNSARAREQQVHPWNVLKISSKKPSKMFLSIQIYGEPLRRIVRVGAKPPSMPFYFLNKIVKDRKRKLVREENSSKHFHVHSLPSDVMYVTTCSMRGSVCWVISGISIVWTQELRSAEKKRTLGYEYRLMMMNNYCYSLCNRHI